MRKRNIEAERRWENKRRAYRNWRHNGHYLLVIQERGGECVDCGEDNPILLCFDHVGEKTKTVSAYRTLAGMRSEAEKCVIRCYNCHRMKTWVYREYPYAERRRARLGIGVA